MLFTEENKFHLHLISDSTGETLGAISRAVLSQFPDVEVVDHMWTLIRTKGQIENILKEVQKTGGIVLYTIINGTLLDTLLLSCNKMGIPCISALDQVILEFSHHLGKEVVNKPGRQHKLDDEYFKRIEAINFVLSHDDGQKIDDLDNADVIIVGPSRTSKSPTCVYLAYRGLKAANVPLVKGIGLPNRLFSISNKKIVGLVISPETLIHIRTHRLQHLKQNTDDPYIDIENVKEELAETRKICLRNKWPIIDVTRRSIEETAVTIIKILESR